MAETKSKKEDIDFNKNDDQMRLLVSKMNQKLAKVFEGGGKKRIEKLHEQGKMSARERIEYLLDEDRQSIEIGAFAGEDMYMEHGGCPAGGVVVVMGYVSGRQCLVVANDATVKQEPGFRLQEKRIYGHRKFRLKIIYRSFIWWIVPEFIYRCRMKFFRIRNISEGFSETMPS